MSIVIGVFMSVALALAQSNPQIDVLRRRAEVGDVQAQIDLAGVYLRAVGEPAAADEARRWIESAATHLSLTWPKRPVRPFHVGGPVKAPKPIYTPDPRIGSRRCIVVLHAILGDDGRVKEMSVVRSHKELDRNAMDALRRWIFQPATLNGKPVPVEITVEVLIPGFPQIAP